MRNFSALTLDQAQSDQPWTIPYSPAFQGGLISGLPHLMGSHAVLHAMKTVGQLAAVFENLDHTGKPISPNQLVELRGKSADLVTAAMRIANLYHFSLVQALVERSEEKNRVSLSWPGE